MPHVGDFSNNTIIFQFAILKFLVNVMLLSIVIKFGLELDLV